MGIIKCVYFDKVNMFKNFGVWNKELVVEFLIYFFEYWVFCYDYNCWVIFVCIGGYLR